MAKSESDQDRAPTPEEVAKTYRIHAKLCGEIGKLMQEVSSLRGELSGNRSAFKKIGGDYKIIQAAFNLEQHDDAARFLRDLNQAVVTVGIITVEEDDGQVSFLKTFEQPSGPEATAIKMGRIRAAGYNDGRAAGPSDNNPYNPGTEEYAVWAKAWKEGCEDREEAASMPSRIPSTEIKRRGRPKKVVKEEEAFSEAAE